MLRRVEDTKRPRRRETYEDLLKVPDNMVAEIIDGVLYTSPRPTLPHMKVSTGLAGKLVPPFQHGAGPGGWRLFFEVELHLADDVLVPDLAGWHDDRMPEEPTGPYTTIPPDWVCEVLSPSTRRLDRHVKLAVYAREVVSHVWLIAPMAKVLDVLDRDGAGWRTQARHGYEERVRAVPFEAVEIALTDIWGPTPPAAQR